MRPKFTNRYIRMNEVTISSLKSRRGEELHDIFLRPDDHVSLQDI